MASLVKRLLTDFLSSTSKKPSHLGWYLALAHDHWDLWVLFSKSPDVRIKIFSIFKNKILTTWSANFLLLVPIRSRYWLIHDNYLVLVDSITEDLRGCLVAPSPQARHEMRPLPYLITAGFWQAVWTQDLHQPAFSIIVDFEQIQFRFLMFLWIFFYHLAPFSRQFYLASSSARVSSGFHSS